MTKPLNLSPPYNIAEVRFGLAGNPTFDPAYIGVALLGDIVNARSPQVADSGVSMTIPVGLEFEPLTPQGPADAFTLGCNFSSKLTFGVDDAGGAQTVHANMSYLRCDLELVESKVGDVHFTTLGVLVRFVLSDVITPLVNLALNQGVPLPSMNRVAIKNSVLSTGPGYVVVASDFAYVPPTKHSNLTPRPLHPLDDSWSEEGDGSWSESEEVDDSWSESEEVDDSFPDSEPGSATPLLRRRR